ncbi:DUF4124 domain-containing protein [Dyella sp. KRB-257]|uniref:DUF4124 domain-containing protein n=1 Tax=Dyella sp. KRB-257 TaxID=3400915 RepID=UPI003C0EE334
MLRPALFALLLLAAGAADAQAYKWTDARGTVHYSESPPPAGTKYSRVTLSGSVDPIVAPAPATEPGTGEGRMDAQPAAPMEDTPENRSKLCASLRSNLDALKGSGPVVMEQDGQPKALNDAERKQQLDAAQAQYSQYCQGQ